MMIHFVHEDFDRAMENNGNDKEYETWERYNGKIYFPFMMLYLFP